jgi:hypothetical protein
MFDPFCRSKRIKFLNFETTVGQLNFFEWAINDDILDYLEEHYEEFHADMEHRLKDEHVDETRKRHELSKSATHSLKHHPVKIKLNFD